MSSGHIFPPRLADDRIKDIIASGGGVSIEDSDIGFAFREACALLVGKTASYAIDRQVDDLWAEYLAFFEITDTSEPFDSTVLLPSFLTEDGLSFLVKQDGKALLQE